VQNPRSALTFCLHAPPGVLGWVLYPWMSDPPNNGLYVPSIYLSQSDLNLSTSCRFGLTSFKHQFKGITTFSHNNILIQVSNDLRYLPLRPLKNQCSTLI